jgi:hypothetical protein
VLRPGYYDASGPPDFRGIIRNDSYGWYRCTHTTHHDPRDARTCARQAVARMPEGWSRAADPDGPIPEGYEVIPRGSE